MCIRDSELISPENYPIQTYRDEQVRQFYIRYQQMLVRNNACLLYTSDAADDLPCVDLGGRRLIKKKKSQHYPPSQTSTNNK